MDYTKGDYGKRPTWQRILVYVVVGGIVYAGVYYTMMKPKGGYNYPAPNTTSTSTPVSGTLSVSVTDQGFTPQVLQVKVGKTVTWTNNTTTAIAVASSPHPTHTDYSPLNLGQINPGESKSVTFPSAGTYNYHNHLNPVQKGTIIVQ